MRLIGISCSGARIYRAPDIITAYEFAEKHNGRVEYGLYLHKWYVLL